MFWSVASVRDEISLFKWSGGSAHLRTFRGALVALLQKMCFVSSNTSFSLMLLYRHFKPVVGKLVQ